MATTPISPRPVAKPLHFGRSLSHSRQNSKPILFSTDFDDTLIHWQSRPKSFDELALSRNTKAIGAAYPVMAVHINTGRGLEAMQQAVLNCQPALANIPVDFLSLNNGQELYVNRHRQRADRWILSLSPADREPGWSLRVRQKTGWNPATVAQVRQAALTQLGFHPLPAHTDLPIDPMPNARLWENQVAGERVIVQCPETQPGFKVFTVKPNGHAVFGPAQKAVGQTILGRMMEMLQSGDQLQATLGTSDAQPVTVKPGFFNLMDGKRKMAGIFTLLPDSIHKGSAIQEVLSHYMRQPRAVITAGDQAYNDLDAMAPPTYAHPIRSKRIPNYPIVSGHDIKLTESVMDNPRHETVPKGRLDQAIVRQLEKAGYRINYSA